jgi:FkbM family methyltransferase
MSIVIKAHTSIIGDTGYNCHSRNFFKALNKIHPIQVRNWTVGPTWNEYSDEPHNDEYYMDEELKEMLCLQTLSTPNGIEDFPIYQKYPSQLFNHEPNVNIVLNDNLHPYFSEIHPGINIAYNVWETTRQPEDFFEKLKRFDQVWVPSEWQRRCTIDQGIPEEKVKVVPEGVDVDLYQPISRKVSRPTDRPFRFLVVGRWEYRKSTKEIIETFIKTFSNEPNIELLLNIDNPFATDGLSSTEERLEKFGLTHPNIKVLHHLSREEYVNLLNEVDVFISCARGEGWNLPLIEAMACGVPSLYSDWGAQLEFAEGRGIPVKIITEVPAAVPNEESWNPNSPGNFAEPDFVDLAAALRDVYFRFEDYKHDALIQSDEIREQFTWNRAAEIAQGHLQELSLVSVNRQQTDFAWVTCGDQGYLPIIEKLAQSLLEFSTRKLLVYTVNCEPTFSLPNVTFIELSVPYHSEKDKWYWKQYACLKSFSEEYENFIWIDGDVVVNHNIDSICSHFNRLTDYPIPDVHLQEEFIGYYYNSDGEIKTQLFNETLCNRESITRQRPFAHICLYLYNRKSEWYFLNILREYKATPLNEYLPLLQWNDEGIDNLLRSRHNLNTFLPVSNFDVSSWNGEELSDNNDAMSNFLTFWRERGPKNFGKIYGWQYVPEDKSSILYFHGNKDPKFAQIMIDYIRAQRDSNFWDTQYFFVEKNKIKNLGEIKGIHGGTLEIASKYGWDYAIYHEIYNLMDYAQRGVSIRPGDTVVDLGGNIGIFTRYAHQMGAKKIVTFEPDSRWFEVLKQNAPPNAILFNAAIGDHLGTAMLTESNHLGGSNLWHPKDSDANQYSVNLYTLDHLFDTGLVENIDFLKVDIEGSEIIALNGIRDENLSLIRNIVVEYHHEHLGFNEETRAQFIDRFTRVGFNHYLLFCGADTALQLIYFWK